MKRSDTKYLKQRGFKVITVKGAIEKSQNCYCKIEHFDQYNYFTENQLKDQKGKGVKKKKIG